MPTFRKMLAATAAGAALLAAGAPAQAAANLIVNGDFETAGSSVTDVAGWSVTGTVARSDGPTYVACCGAHGGPAGNHFATFGWDNLTSVNAISQSFILTLGQLYTLSFDVGALGAATNVLVASADGAGPVSYTVAGNSDLSSTFASQGFSFLGTGVLQTVTFSVTTVPDSTDAILDNVVLTAVPEPATWAMLIAGLGMIGAMLRARRRPVFALS